MSSSGSLHGFEIDDGKAGSMESRSTKRCLAAGCTVALEDLPKYCLQCRLCLQHIKAPCLRRRDGGDTLWRFCQQCGKLEPLSAFDDNKRSCKALLARRRGRTLKRNSLGPAAPTSVSYNMSALTTQHNQGAQVPAAAASASPHAAAAAAGMPAAQELGDVTHAFPCKGSSPNSSSQQWLAHIQQQQQQHSASAQASQAPVALQSLYDQQLVLLEQERQQLQQQLEVLEAFYCAQQQQQQQQQHVWAPRTAQPSDPVTFAPSGHPPATVWWGPLPHNTGSQIQLLSGPGPNAGAPRLYAASPPPVQLQQQLPGAINRLLDVAGGPGGAGNGPRLSGMELLAPNSGPNGSSSGGGMPCDLLSVLLPNPAAAAAAANCAVGATPSPTHHSPASTRVSLGLTQGPSRAAAWSPHQALARAAGGQYAGSSHATTPGSATAESAFDIALRNMRFDDSPPASPLAVGGDCSALGGALGAVPQLAAAGAPTGAPALEAQCLGNSSRSGLEGMCGINMSDVMKAQGAQLAPASVCAAAVLPAAAAGQQQAAAAAAGASRYQLSHSEEQGLLDLMCMDTPPTSLGQWLTAEDDLMADQLASALIATAAGSSAMQHADLSMGQGHVPTQLEGQVKGGPLGQSGCSGPGATSASLSVQVPPESQTHSKPPVWNPFAAAAGAKNSAPTEAYAGTITAAAAANMGTAFDGGAKRNSVQASMDSERQDSFDTLPSLMEIALLEATAEALRAKQALYGAT